jgi:hypothetical protein
MWSSFRRPIRRPTTHTLLDSRHGASRAAEGDFGQCQLLPGLVFSAAIPIRLPIATSERMTFGKLRVNRSLHAPTRANIPTSPYGSRRSRAKWHTRNWQTEVGPSPSDTLQYLRRRALLGKRLNLHGRSGRRRALSRNQRSWFAAIAGAMTCRRVSPSGAIADAASALVNAMGRRHGRGRRRSRNSSTPT